MSVKLKELFLPEVGNRVRLRGRDATGVLKATNNMKWAKVEWDADHPGPLLVHLHELERLDGG